MDAFCTVNRNKYVCEAYRSHARWALALALSPGARRGDRVSVTDREFDVMNDWTLESLACCDMHMCMHNMC